MYIYSSVRMLVLSSYRIELNQVLLVWYSRARDHAVAISSHNTPSPPIASATDSIALVLMGSTPAFTSFSYQILFLQACTQFFFFCLQNPFCKGLSAKLHDAQQVSGECRHSICIYSSTFFFFHL